MRFQTKPAIGLRLREQADAWGVPQRCVVAEAAGGDTPHCRVSPPRRATSPGQRAGHRLRAVPRWQGRTLRWRHGPNGGWRQQRVAVRCWRLTSDGQRQVGWRRGERATRGQPEAQQYGGSTRPAAAMREELAG
jgi:hypothetical protein